MSWLPERGVPWYWHMWTPWRRCGGVGMFMFSCPSLPSAQTLLSLETWLSETGVTSVSGSLDLAVTWRWCPPKNNAPFLDCGLSDWWFLPFSFHFLKVRAILWKVVKQYALCEIPVLPLNFLYSEHQVKTIGFYNGFLIFLYPSNKEVWKSCTWTMYTHVLPETLKLFMKHICSKTG